MKRTPASCMLPAALVLLAALLPVSTRLQAQQSAWEPMNRGLLHLLVYTIEMDPVDSLVMYAGTEYGNLYKSTDGGFNWMMSRTGIPPNYDKELVTALHRDARDRRHLYAGFGGRESAENLFESSDAGATWRTVPTPASWQKAGVLHILTTDSMLYCGLGWYTGIASLRTGDSVWILREGFGVQCIAASPDNPRILLHGTSGRTPLFRSTDAGATWMEQSIAIGSSTKTGVRSLLFSPADPAVVYAGVTADGAGLYRSLDTGRTWARLITTDQISEIAVLPSNPDIIYFSAIHTGVMRSLDGGATWTTLSKGMPTTDVMRVRIAPGWPIRVFAVTLNHGIFRLVDEEITRTQARLP